MKKIWPILFMTLLFTWSALAQSTPEAAFQEFATTEKPAEFVRHLPVALQEAIDQLPPGEKQKIFDKFLIHNMLKHDGITVTATDDPRVFKLERENHPSTTLTLENSFVDGSDALLLMEIKDDKSSQTVLVLMHLQDDDWRVERFGPWDSQTLESDELLEQILPARRNEASALSLLHMLIAALAKYSRTYPDVGYAPTLTALSGAKGAPPSPEHSFILESLVDPLVRDGYRFQYSRSGPSHYQVTASPLEYGTTGGKNFFADETGVIRRTSEDRPATENDERLP